MNGCDMVASVRQYLQETKSRVLKSLSPMMKIGFMVAGLLPLVFLVVYGWFWWWHMDRIYPGVLIADVEVGSMKNSEAEMVITEKVDRYIARLPDSVYHGEQKWDLDWGKSGLSFSVANTVSRAMSQGREGGWFRNLSRQWQIWQEGAQVGLLVEVDTEWIEDLFSQIREDVEKPMVPVQIVYESNRQGDHKVQVNPGEDGVVVLEDKWLENWTEELSMLKSVNTEVWVEAESSELSDDEIQRGLGRARSLLGKSLELEYEDGSGSRHSWVLDEEALITFVDFSAGYDRRKISHYLAEAAEVVNREPQNAVFQFDSNLNRVVEFAPSKDGIEVSVNETSLRLVRALQLLEQTEEVTPVQVVVTRVTPDVSLDSANDLGIVELLGRGESYYRGSIPSRVHNIAVGAAKINGALVPPGEEFSFNQAIGSISQATGFQPAYIIQDGRTVLGDGGGVCQDSTTVFRAALNAGLPITERRAHSYRVGFYEQDAKPGLDASVYAPYSDFRFLNDTPAHILVQARADSSRMHLVVEIYGTSDGREAEILNHTVWDVTPPPPDVWVDDESLDPGEVRQVDWQAWGARARFDYVVRRDGEVLIERTFSSHFRPWAAVYLRGV